MPRNSNRCLTNWTLPRQDSRESESQSLLLAGRLKLAPVGRHTTSGVRLCGCRRASTAFFFAPGASVRTLTHKRKFPTLCSVRALRSSVYHACLYEAACLTLTSFAIVPQPGRAAQHGSAQHDHGLRSLVFLAGRVASGREAGTWVGSGQAVGRHAPINKNERRAEAYMAAPSRALRVRVQREHHP